MNITKLISRFSSAPEDPIELRRVARALGHELPRERLEVLYSFRAEMTQTVPVCDGPIADNPSSFAAGYVASLLDVSAEYETTVRHGRDQAESEDRALREGWRRILQSLDDGPKLPGEIASLINDDHSSVIRSLSRLRMAGLVQVVSGHVVDGRTRPHRLTRAGRRMLRRMDAELSEATVQGIQVAVTLVGHMMRHAASTAHELEAIARRILDDEAAATRAVEAWTQACTQDGMLRDIRQPVRLPNTGDRGLESAPLPEPPALTSDAPWQRAPLVLARVQNRRGHPGPSGEPVPVYVRTSDSAWPAWAFALSQDDNTRNSRTIVDGDILARSIKPPPSRFHLVYDDPSAISTDRNDPTMRAFMERAEEKYVVAYPGVEYEDVPGDFVQIDMLAE